MIKGNYMSNVEIVSCVNEERMLIQQKKNIEVLNNCMKKTKDKNIKDIFEVAIYKLIEITSKQEDKLYIFNTFFKKVL